MKPFSFRTVMLALILVSVVVRVATIRMRDDTLLHFDMTAALIQVAGHAGFEVLPNSAKPSELLHGAVPFRRPSCAAVSWAVPFAFSHEARAVVRRLDVDGYDVRYLYIDYVEPVQNQPRMMLEMLRHTALWVFGDRRYVTPKIALALVEPPGCLDARSPDWRQVWRADQPRAAAGGGRP